jgi:hypothetical protein
MLSIAEYVLRVLSAIGATELPPGGLCMPVQVRILPHVDGI